MTDPAPEVEETTRSAAPPRPAVLLAALGLLVLLAMAAVLSMALRPGPGNAAEALFDIADSSSGDDANLATDDPGTAARWLGERIGVRVPRIDVASAGGKMVGAQSFRRVARGALHFENSGGHLISLHVLLRPAVRVERLAPRTYRGRTFYVGRTEHPGLNLVAWRADGVTLVAASRIGVGDLLPFADEMAKQWELR